MKHIFGAIGPRLGVAGALLVGLGITTPASAVDLYDDMDASEGQLELGVWLRGELVATADRIGDIPLDHAGTTLGGRTGADAQGRLGLQVDLLLDLPLFVRLDGELEYASGQLLDGPDDLGLDLPGDTSDGVSISSAHAVIGLGKYLTVGAGYITSHWGMGLVAHGGSTEWDAQSSMFNDARGGDVARRVFASSGPWSPLGLSAFGFVGDAASDAQLLDGDTAEDAGGGLRFDTDLLDGGLYIVRRVAEAEDGDQTKVTVFDVHLKSTLALTERLDLTLETEAALVAGTSELAPSADFAERDVRQFGWSGRATLATASAGGVFEWLYATGDQNFDDGEQNAFRPDPNYEMGLFLFRHVMASQSGRAPITAGDPELVGVPSQDLDRLPTRGSVSNTLALFPKGYWKPVDGLTVYGGILLALADVPPADARNTRLAGGDPRNALDGDPDGALLGTEFDLGVRYERKVWELSLAAGLELGYLLPGGALVDSDGAEMDPVTGGRLMTRIAF